MPGYEGPPRVRFVATTVLGSIIGAGFMGGIGYTHGSNVAVGALAGAALAGASSTASPRAR